MKKLHDGYVVQGSGLQQFKQPKGLIIFGQKFGQECQKAAQRKEEHEWATEKPKLHSARKSRGIYFSDPDDEEFIDTMEKRTEKVGRRPACSAVIGDSLALDQAIHWRCAPGQPPLSALQLANRRKSARLLTDLVAVFALPPHTCGFTLQRLDLPHTWSDGVTTKST